MKKKLLVIITFLSSILYGTVLDNNYNECSSVVYFGNGMSNSTEQEVVNNADNLELLLTKNQSIFTDLEIKEEQFKVVESENIMFNEFQQALQVIEQKINDLKGNQYYYFGLLKYLEDGDISSNLPAPSFFTGSQASWEVFRSSLLTLNVSYLVPPVYTDPVLVKHVENYRYMINDLGNRVHVIGHSQGNFFANFSHDLLISEGLAPYFNLSGVATPSDRVAGTTNNLILGNDGWVTNYDDEIRFIGLSDNTVNTNIDGNGTGHSFYEGYLLGDKSSEKIYTNIKNQLVKLRDEPSRWNVLEESDNTTQKGTKSYRIKVQDSIDINTEVADVMPFDLGGKIYYTNILNGDLAGQKVLVKGVCGGIGIIDHTSDQVFDANGNRILYELDAPVKQYILEEEIKFVVESPNIKYYTIDVDMRIGEECRFQSWGSGWPASWGQCPPLYYKDILFKGTIPSGKNIDTVVVYSGYGRYDYIPVVNNTFSELIRYNRDKYGLRIYGVNSSDTSVRLTDTIRRNIWVGVTPGGTMW